MQVEDLTKHFCDEVYMDWIHELNADSLRECMNAWVKLNKPFLIRLFDHDCNNGNERPFADWAMPKYIVYAHNHEWEMNVKNQINEICAGV